MIAFCCSVGFGKIPGLVACGDAGGLGPIIAFEAARTPADVARLFGSEPCRSTLVAAQRTGLWLDALGFIPSYTAFLCFAAWGTVWRRRTWLVAALLVAALADEIEGGLMFAILRDLPGTTALLDALFWAVRIKFWLLAAGTAMIGLLLLYSALIRRGPVGMAGIVVLFMGGRALLDLALGAWAGMMTNFTYAWTALLLAAAIGAFWPRLLAAPPPAPARPSA